MPPFTALERGFACRVRNDFRERGIVLAALHALAGRFPGMRCFHILAILTAARDVDAR
ncbi:MAG: hypothetical protein JOZ29_10140 [Deltaproteobacteria bacterium]|nr:hypothetical protein [Deltaproteobacteria bacterium]